MKTKITDSAAEHDFKSLFIYDESCLKEFEKFRLNNVYYGDLSYVKDAWIEGWHAHRKSQEKPNEN